MKGEENYMIGARLAFHILSFLLLVLFVGFGPSSRADRDLCRLEISATRMRGEFRCANLEQSRMLRLPTSRLDGDISVNMGHVTDEMEEIEVVHNGHTWSGFNVSVGNPHAVVFVDSIDQVGSLSEAPQVSPPSSYPEGVNVEFVELLPQFEAKMRVHERGSGETRSCGTGTCAVALAATLKSAGKLPSRWTIYPPGGRLIVDIDAHSNATLTGPAVIIEDHDLSKYVAS